MAMNKSKGDMYGFVDYTFNLIRGRCLNACAYCMPENTFILMSDFTKKDIKDVKVGDMIIGLDKTLSGFSKFIRSKVVANSKRTAKTVKITTEHNEIICTPEHPLMGSTSSRGGTDWKAAKAFSPYETLRYVSKHERGCYSTELRMGYLKGIRDGVQRSQIISIEASGEMEVYNLQTECENFIANGFIVHNCYLKKINGLWGPKNTSGKLAPAELNTNLKKGLNIFVGSSTDMWGDWVTDDDLMVALDKLCEHDNTYLFMTKNPKRYADYIAWLPPKSVLGCTIESNRWHPTAYHGRCPSPEERYNAMMEYTRIKIPLAISIEPVMDFDTDILVEWIKRLSPVWVAVGANTSPHHKLDEPSPDKMKGLIRNLDRIVDVRIKDNLKRILP